MALEVVTEGGAHLCSPCFDATGQLWVCSKGDGGVYRVVERELAEELNSGGQPYGMAFDSSGVLHIADAAEQSLVQATETEGGGRELSVRVADFDGAPLRGPSSVYVDQPTQRIFFTDSGPLGETTLGAPRGGVFVVESGNTVRPLIADGLAHPCAVCVCPKTGAVYCAELLANRLLRFVEQPEGVYHGSVFFQFSGGMGPSCIDCDPDGNIWVGHYEPRASKQEGRISKITLGGEESARLALPGSEITGMCFDQGRERLYITEAAEGKLWRYTLPQQAVNADEDA